MAAVLSNVENKCDGRHGLLLPTRHPLIHLPAVIFVQGWNENTENCLGKDQQKDAQ